MSDLNLHTRIKLFRKEKSIGSKILPEEAALKELEEFENNPDEEKFRFILEMISGDVLLLKRAYSAMNTFLVQRFNRVLHPLKFRLLCGIHMLLEEEINNDDGESEHLPWTELKAIRTVLKNHVIRTKGEDYDQIVSIVREMPSEDDLDVLFSIAATVKRTSLEAVAYMGYQSAGDLQLVDKPVRMFMDTVNGIDDAVNFSRKYLLTPELLKSSEKGLQEFINSGRSGLISLDELIEEALNVAGIKAGRLKKNLKELRERYEDNPDDREVFERLLSYYSEADDTVKSLELLINSTNEIINEQRRLNKILEILKMDASLAGEWVKELISLGVSFNNPQIAAELLKVFLEIGADADELLGILRFSDDFKELTEEYLWLRHKKNMKLRNQLANLLHAENDAEKLNTLALEWEEEDPIWSASQMELLYRTTTQGSYLVKKAELLIKGEEFDEARRTYSLASQKGMDVTESLEKLTIATGTESEREEVYRARLSRIPGDEESLKALFEILLNRSDIEASLSFLDEYGASMSTEGQRQLFSGLQRAFPENGDVRRRAVTFALQDGNKEAAVNMLMELLQQDWDQELADEALRLAVSLNDRETVLNIHTINPKFSDIIWRVSVYEKLLHESVLSDEKEWIERLSSEIIEINPERPAAWRALIDLKHSEIAANIKMNDSEGEEESDIDIEDQNVETNLVELKLELLELPQKMYKSVPNCLEEITEKLSGYQDIYENSIAYHSFMAELYKAAGKHDEELSEYVALSRLDSSNVSYFKKSVDTLLGAERLEEAYELVMNAPGARADVERSLAAFDRILRSAVSLSRRDMALKVLKRIVVLRPGEFSSFEQLAEMYIENDQLDEAFSAVEEGSLLSSAEQETVRRLLERIHDAGLNSVEILDRLSNTEKRLGRPLESFKWNMKRISVSYDRISFNSAWSYAMENQLYDELKILTAYITEERIQSQRAVEYFNAAMKYGTEEQKRTALSFVRDNSFGNDMTITKKWISWLMKLDYIEETVEELRLMVDKDGADTWVISTLKEICSRHDRPDISGWLATLLAGTGNYDEAIIIYRDLLNSHDGMKWLNPLDDLLTMSRKWDDIIDVYEKIFKTETVSIRKRLRVLLIENYNLSLSILNRLQKYFPESPELLKRMINACLDEGRYSKVPSMIRELIRLSPSSADDAMKAITRYKGTGRQSSELYEAEIEILLSRGEYGRAAHTILEQNSDDKSSSEEIARAASLLLKQGNLRETLSLYERHPHIAGSDSEIFLKRLCDLARKQDDNQSLFHLLELRRREDPAKAAIQAELAHMLVDSGRYAEAVERVYEANRLSPEESGEFVLQISNRLHKNGYQSRELAIAEATAYIRSNQYEKVEDILKDYIKDSEEALSLLMKSIRALKEHTKLWKYIRDYVHDKNEKRIQIEEILDMVLDDNAPLAVKILDSLIDEEPDEFDLYIRQAKMYIKRSDFGLIEMLLEKAEVNLSSEECIKLADICLEKAGPVADTTWKLKVMKYMAVFMTQERDLESIYKMLKSISALRGESPLIPVIEWAFEYQFEELALKSITDTGQISVMDISRLKSICEKHIKDSRSVIAFKLLFELVRRRTPDPEMIHLCAEAARLSGRQDELALQFPDIINVDEGNIDIQSLMVIANTYMSIGRFEEARNIASRMSEKGNKREALELLRRIRLERKMSGLKEDPVICVQAARLHRDSGTLELAIMEYENSLSIGDVDHIINELAEVCLEAENYDKALKYLKTILDNNPEDDNLKKRIRDIEKEYSRKRLWTMR